MTQLLAAVAAQPYVVSDYTGTRTGFGVGLKNHLAAL